MGSETIATLVLTAVVVAALALYVLAIGLALRRLSLTLGTILIGLRAIRMQTAPLGPVLDDLVEDVDVIEDALEGVAGAIVTTQSPPTLSEPPTAYEGDEEVPDLAVTDASREPSRALARIEPTRADGRGRAASRSRRDTGQGGRAAPRRRRRRPTPADMRAAIARAGKEMAAGR